MRSLYSVLQLNQISTKSLQNMVDFISNNLASIPIGHGDRYTSTAEQWPQKQAIQTNKQALHEHQQREQSEEEEQQQQRQWTSTKRTVQTTTTTTKNDNYNGNSGLLVVDGDHKGTTTQASLPAGAAEEVGAWL